MQAAVLLQQDFGLISDLIRQHAVEAPRRSALIEGRQRLDYASLDLLLDRIAAALQRDGLKAGDAIAICAGMSIEYAAVFLGALRAGVVVAPLAPGATPASLAGMLADAQASIVFTDADNASALASPDNAAIPRVALDGAAVGRALHDWLAPMGTPAVRVPVTPHSPFNIIYSSGTTGEPKGIVQSHGMRWSHVRRGQAYHYGPQTVTLLATPLYSNTTLVVLFPTLGYGGTVLLSPKFQALEYLQLAQRQRVTHTMLVPVQYQRLLARTDFADFDLSSFQVKFSTSAPFAASLKADVLQRWPGALVEFYGMTEGGGTCILEAQRYPEKLHTVGRPAEGHDIRLIDDAGVELPAGMAGEVVGHSPGMMIGYHRQPAKTREVEWFDGSGKRFIRSGDIGRFDDDGFLVLLDRKKDMIISGGFNIYPSDLEAVLRAHPEVGEAAVVGVPSAQWGETPVAFVVLRPGSGIEAQSLLQWVNARVGKTQRLARLELLDALPRNAIGKVLKRELRERGPTLP
ncbi:MAG: class I adenylate-forming enzyme family protein [Rhodoferax sp.]|uniref:class I adenylate-forming enzyme family protein n=1 Tax=Rhodoferax sp. TaxID=50421 RepID=UPI0026148EDC|nr:class I adenylate-forming enzyme family protein [Rhodoferax sp.]MDD5332709.1 class I adenylate-forming enzyme family protein [Rhodoferax sp.]